MKPDPKERLLAAASGAATDRPPCICPGGMMNMMFRDIMEKSGCPWPAAHSDPRLMAGLSAALYANGGFENYGVPYCMTVEAEVMGAQVDMGDLICEPHVVFSPLAECGDWPQLKPLDINKGRIPCVLQAIRLLHQRNDGVPVIGNITGPVSVAGTLVDMEKLLRTMSKDPDTAHGLLDFVADQLIVYGRAMVEAGADAICIAEPSGTGELLGPRHFRNYTVPYLNKVMDALPVPVKIIHICGKLQSVYKLLADLHCNVFSFDALVPVKEIKPYLEGKAVMGNISTLKLWDTTPERIRGMVRVVKKNGVDIVAPACGLPTTTPLSIVQSMVDATREES